MAIRVAHCVTSGISALRSVAHRAYFFTFKRGLLEAICLGRSKSAVVGVQPSGKAGSVEKE
jgi:hypothetical protein